MELEEWFRNVKAIGRGVRAASSKKPRGIRRVGKRIKGRKETKRRGLSN